MNELGKPIFILLVEDSPGDIVLTKEAMKQAKVHNELRVVTDGVEALNYLNKCGNNDQCPTPDLILLDLNLPKVDGREVLSKIKSNPVLKAIPVVILTTSNDEKDVLNMYDLNANAYIVKPVDFQQFMNVVKSIEDFWLTVVRLPNR
jgi:chemotaxis family two-component system response regulator Rcp1